MAIGDNPWLVLMHQLPPKPPSIRVKVWRRLQALGAVPLKNSVYVLPNTDAAREDFEWVLKAIRKDGAEGSLCEARLVDGLTDDEVQSAFRRAREGDYRALVSELRTFARAALPRRDRPLATAARRRLVAGVDRFRKRLAEIDTIDFFNAPGREAAAGLLENLGRRSVETSTPGPSARRGTWRLEDVHGRTWVTRSGVHVDRIACAWLIRRFIDRAATFRFVSPRTYAHRAGEVRFDMFDAEFTHDGDLCTFEVLLREFVLSDPALRAIAELVHDVDLKDEKFGREETPGFDHLILGIAWAHPGDEARIAQGGAVLDALYAFFGRRKR